ncbi:hypothetical protein ACH5RR_012767 [Cinchona calisaya]|uniref:DUF8040 domain-containing protein n=1 Tax=Cinchona calisaya TaxID=153742 RepID=A0ABD3A8N3_9GENT
MENYRWPPLPEKRPTKMVRTSSGPSEIFSMKEVLNVRKESPLSNLDPQTEFRSLTILEPADEETNRGEEWDKLKKWAATCVVAYATYATFLFTLLQDSNTGRQLVPEDTDYERHVLLERLTNIRDEDCCEQLRMGKMAFTNLVYIIRQRGLLSDSVHGRVEERVAMFLHTLAMTYEIER